MSKQAVKVLSVLVLLVLLLGLGGCAEKTPEEFKIGVVTGTVSQGEDEYRAAERVKAKYGDRIIHVTYPDNFMQEQETTIAQITGLASDQSVKAIVICQAVPGTAAAIDKIRQTRKDVLILVGVPHEDPKIIAGKADLAFETDNLERGRTIVRLAKEMGAKAFLHYSFPRHMSMELLARRRDIMEEECKNLGMEFVFVTAPDPMGPEGIPGAQKFILEDVPRQVAARGKDIAVFSTNCAMQEPLIKAALEAGAIFPEQCCPSPTHGYPGALEIDVSGMAGNMQAILSAIEEKIVAKGGAGRFATWPVPINMVFIETAVELAFKAVEGKVKLDDMEAVKAAMKEVAGVDVQMKRYEEGKNMYLVVSGSYIFGKK